MRHRVTPEMQRIKRTWRNMIRRCTVPKCAAYRNYGGRGIVVCPEWMGSFERFVADMGMPPQGMSLERVDNNGPYSPENCAWVSCKQQCINRRSTVFLEYGGQRLSLSDWSRKTGIGVTTIHSRLLKGWNPSEILETPTHPRSCGWTVRAKRREVAA